MMGFKEAEVKTILQGIEVPDEELEEVQDKIKQWYNGYLFSKYADERVYNSDMVLYFALHCIALHCIMVEKNAIQMICLTPIS